MSKRDTILLIEDMPDSAFKKNESIIAGRVSNKE